MDLAISRPCGRVFTRKHPIRFSKICASLERSLTGRPEMTPGLESRYGQGVLQTGCPHPKTVTQGAKCPALNNFALFQRAWGSLKELLQKAKPLRSARQRALKPALPYQDVQSARTKITLRRLRTLTRLANLGPLCKGETDFFSVFLARGAGPCRGLPWGSGCA